MKNPLRPLSCIVEIKKKNLDPPPFIIPSVIDEREKIPKTQLQKN